MNTRNKKVMTALILYGLIIASLIVTMRLADKMSASINTESVIAGELDKAADTSGAVADSSLSGFGKWVSGLAEKFPIWVYVIIFLVLVFGTRLGMNRYYSNSYYTHRKNLAKRGTYTHVRHYKDIDPNFSNDRFAEMVGKKQELIQRCAADSDFMPVKNYVSETMFEVMGNKENGFALNMTQIALNGFKQEEGMDIMSVMVSCVAKRGFGNWKFEWLFCRESGLTTSVNDEGEDDIMNEGGWILTSVICIG